MQSVTYKAVDIVKQFSGVTVLNGISFEVRPGRIHALLGHNGAGKSTLLKILAGDYMKDGGKLLINDREVEFHEPSDALREGIACVYQELRLIPELSVWQNLFLGRELRKGKFLDKEGMRARTREVLSEYGLKLDVDTSVGALSHPDKQMLEVVANLDRDARVLFLDEPTTALEGAQASRLLTDVKRICREKQIGVVLVSHKIDEVLEVCDEVTVMCGGKVIFNATGEKMQKQAIIDAIIGDARNSAGVISQVTRKLNRPEEVVLEVRDLHSARLKGVSLKACQGSILGIYGLVGSGRTRFGRTIFGLEEGAQGEILYKGKPYTPRDPGFALKNGIVYLTEERKKDGFIPLMNSYQNSTLPVLNRFREHVFVNHGKAWQKAGEVLNRIDTKGNLTGPMQSLSGGNQQKVLFSRVINQDASLVILDEPTKGVDIGAKSDIYKIIFDLAAKGCAVIVISSEEEELLSLSDSILVFRSGTCSGQLLDASQLTVAGLRQAAWE